MTSKDDEEDLQDEKVDDILIGALNAWLTRRQSLSDLSYQPIKDWQNGHKHVMIDIGKKRSRTRKIADISAWGDRCLNIEDSWTRLFSLRTAENAKKRFLCCRNAPVDYALMCYVVSSAYEQPSLRLFFDRHSKGVTDFEDRATRVLNTWETEFHCSLLQLVRPQDLENQGTGNKKDT